MKKAPRRGWCFCWVDYDAGECQPAPMSDFSEYAYSQARELAEQARQNGMTDLAYLLEMAAEEALNQPRQQPPARRPQLLPPPPHP